SPSQLRLWRLQRVHGHEPFQISCTVRIAGVLDEARLRRAIEGVVSRHESLRSTLVLTSTGVQEVVGSEPRYVYLGGAATMAADEPPLEHDAPPLRVSVAPVAERLHDVTLMVSSTWADLHSMVTVVDDLASLYGQGHCRGNTSMPYGE